MAAPHLRGGIAVLEGKIMPQVSASKLLETWNGRVEAPIAPQANLQTDGSTFRIAYSQTWDVLNLKHVFEMEVHRILPSAQVSWA